MKIGTIKQIWRYPVKSMAGEQLEVCSVGPLGIPGDRGWALRDETTGEITNGKRLPLLMQCAARYLNEPTADEIPNVEIQLFNGTTFTSGAIELNSQLSELLNRRVTLGPRQPATNREHYRRKGKAARVFGTLARYRAFRAAMPALTRVGNANSVLRQTFSREPDEPIPDLSLLPPEIIEFTSPLGTYFDAFPIHVLTTASLEAMHRFNPSGVWDVRRFRPNVLIQTETSIEGLVEAQWSGKVIRLGEVELSCKIPTMRCGMTMQAQRDLPKDSSILRSIVKDAAQNLGRYASVLRDGQVRVGDAVFLS